MSTVIVMLYAWSKQRRRRSQSIAVGPASAFEREVSSTEFDELVLANSHRTPVVVDFYANWCGPCHAFAPVLAETAKDFNGAFLLAKVNFDENKALADAYDVTGLPTVALFLDGKCVDRFSGGKLPHSLKYFLAANGIPSPDSAV